MSRPIRRERDSNGNLKPYNRCRHWELQVSVCASPGRYAKRSRRFHGTYREACEELSRFKVSVRNELPSSGWMVTKWLKTFSDERRQSGLVAKNTCVNFDKAKDDFISTCGDMRLEEVNRQVMLNWRDDMLSRYKKSTVQTRIFALSPAFEKAVKDGLIPVNPIRQIEVPRPDKRDDDTLTEGQMATLISKLDTDDVKQLGILLCVLCGLRRGEACALLWKHLKDGVLHVRNSMDSERDVGTTKGKRVREVPVPAFLDEILESKRGDDDDYILSPGGGLSLSPNTLYGWWKRNREKIGIGSWRLHDLRHAYVTQLCRDGVPPAVVQKLAGHASITTTMEVYTHVDMEQRRAAAASLDERFAANLRQ